MEAPGTGNLPGGLTSEESRRGQVDSCCRRCRAKVDSVDIVRLPGEIGDVAGLFDQGGSTAMYKVIVVGTDGSERATVAVNQALELAKMCGAKLHAVHVVHPAVKSGFSDTSGGQFEIDAMRERAEKSGAQLLADAKRHGVDAEMHHPSGGEPADALISIAEATGADLIVVGNRGMTGMKRFVLGSVPNKVSHNCPCNLLIVNTEPT
jgi:nucleotide-binding universal stress UspA family protein